MEFPGELVHKWLTYAWPTRGDLLWSIQMGHILPTYPSPSSNVIETLFFAPIQMELTVALEKKNKTKRKNKNLLLPMTRCMTVLLRSKQPFTISTHHIYGLYQCYTNHLAKHSLTSKRIHQPTPIIKTNNTINIW